VIPVCSECGEQSQLTDDQPAISGTEGTEGTAQGTDRDRISPKAESQTEFSWKRLENARFHYMKTKIFGGNFNNIMLMDFPLRKGIN